MIAKLRRTVLLSGIFLLSMSVGGRSVLAAPPGPAPPGGMLIITEVLVTFGPPDSITITGENFGFGVGPLVVTLGEFGPLNITATDVVTTPNTIDVDCPPSDPNSAPDPVTNPPTCPNGDFLLTVSNSTGQSENDEYDLTMAGGADGGGGPMSCPDGFTEVTDQYCIETDQKSGDTWVAANSTCITANARLCTAGEWVYACLNATSLSLLNLPSGLEWLGDLASGPNANRLGQGVSSPSCTAGSSGLISSGSELFRCCFAR